MGAWCVVGMSLLPLIAQLPAPDSPESVGWLVLTISGILGGAYYAVSAWRTMFPVKNPPDHDVWATKLELAKLERDHKEEMKRIEDRFEVWLDQQAKQHDEKMKLWGEWRDGFSDWQLKIERAIGHVETKAEMAVQQKNTRR